MPPAFHQAVQGWKTSLIWEQFIEQTGNSNAPQNDDDDDDDDDDDNYDDDNYNNYDDDTDPKNLQLI